MSLEEKQDRVRVAIVTASDSAFQGTRGDLSGPLLKDKLERSGFIVVDYRVIPDELGQLKDVLVDLCDGDLDMVLTTGGTGFSPRDVTPEATLEVIDREVPGIPEAMRAGSLKKTPHAMLSRARAGIRGRTLIVNMPGSPKACAECLDIIFPALSHAAQVLRGDARECAGGEKTSPGPGGPREA